MCRPAKGDTPFLGNDVRHEQFVEFFVVADFHRVLLTAKLVGLHFQDVEFDEHLQHLFQRSGVWDVLLEELADFRQVV